MVKVQQCAVSQSTVLLYKQAEAVVVQIEQVRVLRCSKANI